MKLRYVLNEGAGCAHYRCLLPGGALALRGHEASADWEIEDPEGADDELVIGLRVNLPHTSAQWQRLAARGVKLILDIDDDLFNIHPSNEVPYKHFSGEVLDRLKANLEVSTAVTVSTEALADVMRPYNPNIYVLPNAIDEHMLAWQRPQRERVTLGWAGTSCHAPDFESAAKPLSAFLSKATDVDVHLMGGDYRDVLRRPDARYTGWHEAGEFYNNIDFDIAMIPLAWHSFNRSKSDLKLLEFSALGIPTVASDYGPYTEIIHGKTGFLVNQDHQWKKYLRELINDPQLRAEVGGHAKEWAATRTVQSRVGDWERVYAEVLAA